MSDATRFLLVAKDIFANAETKLILDTKEELAKAVEEGFIFRTPFSFSEDPRQNLDCVKFGDLVVEFVDLHNPLNAVKAARSFVTLLEARFDVAPFTVAHFLGVDRARIVVPAIGIGSTCGDKDLPQIYCRMVKDLTDNFSGLGKNFDTTRIDIYSILYSYIQIENTSIDGISYIVPVSNIDLFMVDDNSYKYKIGYKKISHIFLDDIVENFKLNKFYRICQEEEKALHLNKPRALECAERECAFISYCRDNSNIISHKAWSSLLSNLSKLGIIGREMALYYAKNTPFYAKFNDDFVLASNANACSCSEIKNGIFECNRNCGVEFPYLLSESSKNSPESHFIHGADGLYSLARNGENGPMKVCSPIEIIALCRESSGKGWGKIVKLVDPIGEIHTLVLSMADMGANTESTFRKLMSYGLQLSSYKFSKNLLLDYLTTYSPNTFATLAKKSGWIGKCYIIKDAIFGNVRDELYIIDDAEYESPLQVQGGLEEWKEHVGKLCDGQKLLMLAVSYALSGFLLTPCGYEGGGLHIFGPSSTGKTTALDVAASVCGGGKGYVKQWRTTDNALESIAARHNDGFLCLDEIGQATSKVVSEVSYMLTNGQGKARANKEGNAKSVQTWNLNFMSTGEITLADSIAADFGKELMAGQAVRILDIPSDAGTGNGVFTYVPAGMTGHSFSQNLVRNANKFYGSPARAFIEKFAINFDANVERVKTMVSEFVKTNCPSGSSGQVLRAAQRFGLIAAAGELAILWEIFPWIDTEAEEAAKFGLEAWIRQRGGVGDHEMTNALQRLQDFILLNESRFVPTNSSEREVRSNLAGYKWRDTKTYEEIYGILLPVFKNEISRRVNQAALISELEKRGWIHKNSAGNRLETKSVRGSNCRIVPVVPDRWLETSDAPQNSHGDINDVAIS